MELFWNKNKIHNLSELQYEQSSLWSLNIEVNLIFSCHPISLLPPSPSLGVSFQQYIFHDLQYMKNRVNDSINIKNIFHSGATTTILSSKFDFIISPLKDSLQRRKAKTYLIASHSPLKPCGSLVYWQIILGISYRNEKSIHLRTLRERDKTIC